MTLFDYLPSQNAWKVRLLLHHLGMTYRTEIVSIFEGEGRTPAFLAMNPTGAVPVLQLDDGRTLAESNAILFHLAHGTPYLPADPFGMAQVVQWLCFEADYVQSSVATLRHWVMTGKDRNRPPALVAARRDAAAGVLTRLDTVLGGRDFLAAGRYTIADMAVYAYVHRAEEAALDLSPHGHLRAWIARVAAQPGYLATMHPYSIDPHSARELP